MHVDVIGRYQMCSNATTVSSHCKLRFLMQKWDFLLMSVNRTMADMMDVTISLLLQSCLN